MPHTNTPRRTLRRALVLAAALAALVLPPAPASASDGDDCHIIGGVDWVGVELLDPPGSGSGLSATRRELMRREHAHVSSTLADMLALDGLVGSDPFGPNPQVRVVIEEPETIHGRSSFAIFTVTEIFESQDLRIRVFAQDDTDDKDSGEYKLFADDPDETGAVQEFDVHEGGLLDQILVGVSARVLVTPVSPSTVAGGRSFTADYCESDKTGFEEEAVLAPGTDVAILAPHGGAIEVRTSNQLDALESALAGHGVVANVWNIEGSWARGQTFKRLHITAPALSTDSYPGLRQLMAKSDHAAGIPFRYAVALHGYSSSQKGIILGGRAEREAKCLVAQRIRDELESARGDRDEIGFRIQDDGDCDPDREDEDCDLTITSAAGYVPPDKYSGLSDENLVNRVSPNPSSAAGWGGFQLEQTRTVRKDETNPGNLPEASDGWLRNVVARGVAQGLVELLAYGEGQGPSGVCDSLH